MRTFFPGGRSLKAAFSAIILAVAMLGGAAVATAGVLIEVDKEAQRMSVSVDGQMRYMWAVSTGRAGKQTPAGDFTPFRLEEDHYSKEWDDAPMPHSIFFTRTGHAIHGSNDIKRLGQPASAGCVRLHPAHAATLFKLVKDTGLNNVKISIDGEEPPPAVARRAPAPQGGPRADGARVWPDGQAERESLRRYAERMRQQYYREYQPQPYYQPRAYYYARPQYQTRPYYYGEVVPRGRYQYWD